MVGVVHDNLRPGELCYVVLKNPDGGNEYVEGRFLGILPENNPAWNHFAERGLPSYAKPAQALVAYPATPGRDPIDPIVPGQVPGRAYYAIIPVKEYAGILEKKILAGQQEKELAKQDLVDHISRSTLTIDGLEKARNSKAVFYLLIGMAFGIAGGLGYAAFDNYQRIQSSSGK